MIYEALITGIVLFGVYSAIKLISDHLLKRKLIKAGQYEKVSLLEPPKPSEETNRYPSLKWGLVALMAGLGLILIEILRDKTEGLIDYHNAVMPLGILLVFVAMGFLLYFFIVNKRRNNPDD